MNFRTVLAIAAIALPGAALAQGKGGQGKASIAQCSVMPMEAETLECACPPGFGTGDAWGSGPYTGDSDICSAALHAGVIGADGGSVRVTREATLTSYPGSSSNGVTTSSWDGSYDFAIAVAAAGGMDVAECDALPASGESATCSCPADAQAGSVWGSGPYTGDSDICTAARHAGLIGAGGGTIRITNGPGEAEYPGSDANGVSTSSWGSYGESLVISAAGGGASEAGSMAAFEDIGACDGLPDGDNPVTCSCGSVSAGAVWGSGPYTGDSDICTAAVHAGVIGKGGGQVLLVRRPGADSYTGSDANGVSTDDWGSYDESFAILTEPPAASPGVDSASMESSEELQACTILPDGVDRHRCTCGRGLARGDVWGVGPYTSDSDICTAARHAGVIRSFGGEVHVLRIQGLDFYTGGADNGVSTSKWDDSYDSSIVFDRN